MIWSSNLLVWFILISLLFFSSIWSFNSLEMFNLVLFVKLTLILVIYNNMNIAKAVTCNKENVIFGWKYGALLQPYLFKHWDIFFLRRPWILVHLCPHPPSINRASFSSLKHTLSYSLVLSSFLSYISSLILGLFIYSFLRVTLLVLRSLEIPRSSCCILGGLRNTLRISP